MNEKEFLIDVREGYGDDQHEVSEKDQQIFEAIQELKDAGVEEMDPEHLADYLQERVPGLSDKEIEEYFPWERRYGDE